MWLLGCMLLTFSMAAAVAAPVAADAQESARGVVYTSAPLPQGHWAVQAARRAEALGLVSDFLPAQRSVPRLVVGAVLRDAALEASSTAPGLTGLTEGWLARFVEEFPESQQSAVPAAPPPFAGGSAAGVQYGRHQGRAAPGEGEYPPDRTGALPLADAAGITLGASLSLLPQSWVAVAAAAELSDARLSIPSGDLVLGWGKLGFSVGRQPVGYGYAEGGGVVLAGNVALDRVQVETTQPLELPGWLRYLGPTAFNTFFTRFYEERHVGEPFFWGASLSVQPHSRFTVSIHRASTIGGGLAPEPISARSLLLTFVGKHTGHLADQVVSAEFRYRLPTESVLPITVYGEWGSEDSAGSFYKVPGIMSGVFVAALPVVPEVSVGFEYSQFGTSCCGNPPWYRHVAHPGNWVLRDRPLAHPAGGDGSEVLVYGRWDALSSRLQLDGRAFRRDRGDENLFSPERHGTSSGFAASAGWRIRPRAELFTNAFREGGAGWVEQQLRVGTRILF